MQSASTITDRPSIATDTVVAFIDFQHGIAEMAGTLDGKHLRRGLGHLAHLAQVFAIPSLVIAVAPPGMPEPQIYGEIEEHLGPLPTMLRSVPDSFHDGAIRGAIEATQRKTLVLAGVFTEVAVLLPALSAVAAGYDVHVVVDACGGETERTEHAALLRMAHAGVKTTSLVTLCAEFAGTFATPEGQKALEILQAVASKK